MSRLKRILTVPRRALARAPRWVRIAVTLVWVLVLAVALGIGVQSVKDDAYQRGFEAGVSASAPAPVAEPELPSWLPAGTNRAAALAAMQAGVPFQVESRDEGFGCSARMLLLPNGELWWLQKPDASGEVLHWEVGVRGLPQMGCFNTRIPSQSGGGR